MEIQGHFVVVDRHNSCYKGYYRGWDCGFEAGVKELP